MAFNKTKTYKTLALFFFSLSLSFFSFCLVIGGIVKTTHRFSSSSEIVHVIYSLSVMKTNPKVNNEEPILCLTTCPLPLSSGKVTNVDSLNRSRLTNPCPCLSKHRALKTYYLKRTFLSISQTYISHKSLAIAWTRF